MKTRNYRKKKAIKPKTRNRKRYNKKTRRYKKGKTHRRQRGGFEKHDWERKFDKKKTPGEVYERMFHENAVNLKERLKPIYDDLENEYRTTGKIKPDMWYYCNKDNLTFTDIKPDTSEGSDSSATIGMCSEENIKGAGIKSLIGQLTPGDNIYYKCAFGASFARHHGVYMGRGVVIEFHTTEDVVPGFKAICRILGPKILTKAYPGIVTARDIREFKSGKVIKNAEGKEEVDPDCRGIFIFTAANPEAKIDEYKPRDQWESIKRAYNMIGPKEYRVASYNCQNFASEACSKSKECSQTRNIMRKVYNAYYGQCQEIPSDDGKTTNMVCLPEKKGIKSHIADYEGPRGLDFV